MIPGAHNDDHGSSNMAGFMHVLLKTELELAVCGKETDEDIVNRFRQLKTLGQAQEYLVKIMKQIEAVQA